MDRNIVQRIHSFNQGRNPDLVRLKYQRMRANSFAFFRGTCHLFFQDWPQGTTLDSAPLAWSCGDLHLENFGSYKGDNRLTYFDINDFDEAVLAPCTWDLARFLTSIHVAAYTLKLNEAEVATLSLGFMSCYSTALAHGKAYMVEAETAEGMVKELLDNVKDRKRKDFIGKHTHIIGGRREIIIDGKHTTAITPQEQTQVESFMKSWGAKQSDPGFFQLIDVSHRIAGTGSLGLDRFVLLVEGNRSSDHHYILDLKEARTSSLHPPNVPQSSWDTEAERIVAIQQRVQGTSPALLFPVEMGQKAYVLRELQPIEDRVDLNNWQGKLRRLEKVIETMAKVVAWGQIRSSGRQKSAIADELIEFAGAPLWQDELLKYAKIYSSQVEADYAEFCASLTQ
jgi:uncharacterized protein (DUF2252 family)